MHKTLTTLTCCAIAALAVACTPDYTPRQGATESPGEEIKGCQADCEVAGEGEVVEDPPRPGEPGDVDVEVPIDDGVIGDCEACAPCSPSEDGESWGYGTRRDAAGLLGERSVNALFAMPADSPYAAALAHHSEGKLDFAFLPKDATRPAMSEDNPLGIIDPIAAAYPETGYGGAGAIMLDLAAPEGDGEYVVVPYAVIDNGDEDSHGRVRLRFAKPTPSTYPGNDLSLDAIGLQDFMGCVAGELTFKGLGVSLRRSDEGFVLDLLIRERMVEDSHIVLARVELGYDFGVVRTEMLGHLYEEISSVGDLRVSADGQTITFVGRDGQGTTNIYYTTPLEGGGAAVVHALPLSIDPAIDRPQVGVFGDMVVAADSDGVVVHRPGGDPETPWLSVLTDVEADAYWTNPRADGDLDMVWTTSKEATAQSERSTLTFHRATLDGQSFAERDDSRAMIAEVAYEGNDIRPAGPQVVFDDEGTASLYYEGRWNVTAASPYRDVEVWFDLGAMCQ